jgi:hypothetical protein
MGPAPDEFLENWPQARHGGSAAALDQVALGIDVAERLTALP